MALQPSEPIRAEDEGIIEPLCAVFRRSLKDEGLKYTPERAQILDSIIELDGLFEAEQLLEEVKAKGFRVSKATVYRTLKLLEESGIVQRVLFDRDQSHYQLAYGRKGNTVLVRVDTGEAEVLELPELVALRDKICKARGLKAEGHRLQIFATKA
jgi:Fur family ferric uptake transcriptional regulator